MVDGRLSVEECQKPMLRSHAAALLDNRLLIYLNNLLEVDRVFMRTKYLHLKNQSETRVRGQRNRDAYTDREPLA